MSSLLHLIATRPQLLADHAENYAAPAAVEIARVSASERGFPIGAHLVTSRRGYSHHGIYIGAGKVVHYAGLSLGIHRGPVEEATLADFADGRVVKIKFDANARYSGAQVAARARSRLGEDRYRLTTNNCEHFCEWCARGESRSEQIEKIYARPRRAMLVALARLRHSFSAGLGDRRDETCAV